MVIDYKISMVRNIAVCRKTLGDFWLLAVIKQQWEKRMTLIIG